jgi:indolepyruvate ferredoxin oxidoreductase
LPAKLKFLRGAPFDPFGWSAERARERALAVDYGEDLAEISTRLSPATYMAALELARSPETIRGFGHVKTASMAKAAGERKRPLTRLRQLASERRPPVGAGACVRAKHA